MKTFIAGMVIVACVIAGFATTATATNDKITICHVAGLASDPANYITLNLPYPAVYGPGGHFNENGTTQAGHEQDTLGACNPPPPPHDECEDIPGDQPEGYDCTPDEPPCTVNCEPPPPCTVNCTPPPPVERCPPGMFPTNGKDGEPGNDECEYPQPPPTTTVVVPPVTGGTPPVTTTTPTVTPPPTVVVTSKPPKVVKVKVVAKSVKKTKLTGNPKKDNCKELKNALLKCKVGGKTIVVVQGSG